MGTDFLRLTYEGGRDVPQVFICESQPVGIFSFLVPFLLMFDCMTDLLSWGVMRAQVFQMCFVPQHDKPQRLMMMMVMLKFGWWSLDCEFCSHFKIVIVFLLH